nr:sterol-4-alpha-carboxylate 3-dehydrogenase, decarboxylating [Quercus suber]
MAGSQSSQQAKQILVTGASGFLGRNIVLELLKKHPECRISALDIHPPNPETQQQLQNVFNVDIRSVDSVQTVFATGYIPDLVIHTAGVVPARASRYSTNASDWERVRAINYDGTKNILDCALAAGCRRMLYTSSSTVLGDDLDHDYYNADETLALGHTKLHYGKSKAMAERYVLSDAHRKQGLKACALRPMAIIGEGDTAFISLMHDLIAKGETTFVVGDGYNIYDFMYISNAVDAHVLAAENLLDSASAAGHAFFISNGEPCYFWDFLAYVWAQFDHVPPYRIYIAASLAWFVALVLEWITWLMGTAPTLDRNSVREGIRTFYASNDKATEILGYVPRVSLAEAVRRSCARRTLCKVMAEEHRLLPSVRPGSCISSIPQKKIIGPKYVCNVCRLAHGHDRSMKPYRRKPISNIAVYAYQRPIHQDAVVLSRLPRARVVSLQCRTVRGNSSPFGESERLLFEDHATDRSRA